MKKVIIGLRILFGLEFLVFGANKFFNFLPMPEMAGEAGNYMGALFSTGYMFPTIAIIEILAGLALITNKYTALMLVVLAPVTFNIFGFHASLAPDGLAMGVVMMVLHVFLMLQYKNRYVQLLKA